MPSTSKLSEKNPAWYDARIEVLDRFFDNIIDFETFKQEIAEVDDKYRNPEKLTEIEIIEMKQKIEKYKKYAKAINLDNLNYDPERVKYIRLKRQLKGHGTRTELDVEEYERLRKKFES